MLRLAAQSSRQQLRALLSTNALARHYACASVPPPDLLDSAGAPPHWVSPSVECKVLSGRGRGLVASTPFRTGDLVLAVQPLSILKGPHEEMPDPSALAPMLWQLLCAASQPPSHAHQHPQPSSAGNTSTDLRPAMAACWLPLLDRGCADQADPQHQALALQALLHHQPCAGGESAPKLSSQAAIPGCPTPSLSPQDMEHIVARNAFGDEYEDLVASDIRCSSQPGINDHGVQLGQTADGSGGEDPAQSHVGLWPHFALLNHSCLPSCVHYVIDSTMVVRAVQDVPSGQELTVSYLGREDFSPVAVRQRLLLQRFGFTCSCPRCRLESSALSPQIKDTLARVNRDIKLNLGPTFLDAIQAEDREGLAQVGNALVAWSKELQPALQDFMQQAQHALSHRAPNSDHESSTSSSSSSRDELGDIVAAVGGPEAAVLMLEATAYDYFELLQQHTQLCAAMGEGGSPEQEGEAAEGHVSSSITLHLCGQILHATSRGSELHVFVATRLLELAREQQAAGGVCTLDTAEARQACEEALLARYGQLPQHHEESVVRACVGRSRQFIL